MTNETRAEKAEARVVALEALCKAQHGAVARAERAEAKVAAGLSWGGFNLFGDRKSIDEAKRLVHEAGRSEQLVVLIKDERARAERAEAAAAAADRCMRDYNRRLISAEAERDAIRELIPILIEAAELGGIAWMPIWDRARAALNP